MTWPNVIFVTKKSVINVMSALQIYEVHSGKIYVYPHKFL